MARILVAYRNPDYCKILVGLFEDEGHQAAYVHTAEDAISAVQQQPLDLIVTEAYLPHNWASNEEQRGGFQVANAAREEGIPVIMVSYLLGGSSDYGEIVDVRDALAQKGDTPLARYFLDTSRVDHGQEILKAVAEILTS